MKYVRIFQANIVPEIFALKKIFPLKEYNFVVHDVDNGVALKVLFTRIIQVFFAWFLVIAKRKYMDIFSILLKDNGGKSKI